MNKLITLLLLNVMLLLGSSLPKASAASVASANALADDTVALVKQGMACPDFALTDYKGKVWRLADFKGKLLVIDFWATWCGVCIANLPSYAELAASYKGDSRIQFITISIDSRDAQKHWMYSLPRYHLMDLVNLICPDTESEFSQAFGVRGVPRYVVIGADGTILEDKAPTPHDGLNDVIKKYLK